MKVTTPEISWHERDPIYSVDFQPGNHPIQRLASGGVDKIVRIWQMTYDSEGKGDVEFLSNLRRHTASINVVRFSKNGELLASAGDDSAILVWKLSDVPSPSNNIFSEEDLEEDKETWVCHKTLRGHLGDVQDLSWSKDSRYLVSGSVDNSAIVWDVHKAQKLAFFNDHKSYVQGVTFDPLGDYIATLSSDRSMRIFSLTSKNCVHNVSKMTPALMDEQNSQTDAKPKPFRIFHDDGLRSFFRRLEFSSDGHLLLAPAGCVEVGDKQVNCSFVFVRGAFARPALYLPSGEKATIIMRANPQLFELRQPKDYDPECQSEDTPEWESHKSLFSLPHRIIFAAATDDSVLIYDSQQTMPIALLKNIHYHQISDLSWSPDGLSLIISSTDGFCTISTFEEGELGIPYSGKSRRKDGTNRRAANKMTSSLQDTESPGQSTPSTLPFSRYTDDKTDKESKEKVPEVNTKLNIRRVETKSKLPATPVVNDKEKNGEETSPKINTSLNIRKKKKESSPIAEKLISKVQEPDGIDKNDVEMTCDDVKSGNSKINEDSSPRINTTLNIRKVKKEEMTADESKVVPKVQEDVAFVKDAEMKNEDSKNEVSEKTGKVCPKIENTLKSRVKTVDTGLITEKETISEVKADDISHSVQKIDIDDVEMSEDCAKKDENSG